MRSVATFREHVRAKYSFVPQIYVASVADRFAQQDPFSPFFEFSKMDFVSPHFEAYRKVTSEIDEEVYKGSTTLFHG